MGLYITRRICGLRGRVVAFGTVPLVPRRRRRHPPTGGALLRGNRGMCETPCGGDAPKVSFLFPKFPCGSPLSGRHDMPVGHVTV
jgi:hypothetical protein